MTRPLQEDQAAFPVDENKYFDPELGLTKREYFAAQALTGILSAKYPQTPTERAIFAVNHADALIKALRDIPA